MKRIIVVGSSNTDLIGYCERYPEPGETILGTFVFLFLFSLNNNEFFFFLLLKKK